MFQRGEKESKAKEGVEKVTESTPMSVSDPIATAAAASVLYSWYHYYLKGNKQYAVFTGLWAPTLLSAASYLQQKDIVRKFKQGFSSF